MRAANGKALLRLQQIKAGPSSVCYGVSAVRHGLTLNKRSFSLWGAVAVSANDYSEQNLNYSHVFHFNNHKKARRKKSSIGE